MKTKLLIVLEALACLIVLVVHQRSDAVLGQVSDEGKVYLPIIENIAQEPGSLDQMLNIPAGEFLMGCQPGSNGGIPCPSDALQHKIYLDAYTIDRYEVTNVQYALCVADRACSPPFKMESFTRPNYFGNPSYGKYPVIYVTWQDAVDYCNWAGKRLPTEAEWEKAARGTDGRLYPWGDQAADCERANFLNIHLCSGDTSQVGYYPSGASPYGAHDMAGNVMEWVSDWYQANYYDISPYSNPLGPDSGTYKVLRGGSWFIDANYVKSTYRLADNPDDFSLGYGFRCASSKQ